MTSSATLPAATATSWISSLKRSSAGSRTISRQFLSRTAVLGRFTAPLCDAVAGTSDAREILDALERENLFLIALDDHRQWFRYHHLFAQLLLAQLARAEPGALPGLHQRASAWYLQHGSVDEAVDHALKAGDVTRSVSLIAGHWYLVRQRGPDGYGAGLAALTRG